MTSDKPAEERVKAAVARVFHKEITELSRDIRFREDLLAKSVNVVELTAILEYEFNIEIPRKRARLAATIGDVIDLIEDLLTK